MEWVIRWEKDGIERVTLCISNADIALRYAIMRENQGFNVTITEREWTPRPFNRG